MNYQEASARLRACGQEHVLRFWEELGKGEREELLKEISALDIELLESAGKRPERGGNFSPIHGPSLEEIGREKARFEREGLAAVAAGKVAAVLLAGGQGTRLGSDAPKGAYDIGVSRPLYIFECLFRNLAEVTQKTGGIPFFIMTSEKNDGETRRFLRAHDYFGYPPELVSFFVQDMAPSLDFSGKLLLEEKGRLALSPNGNGGWYSSLVRAGLCDKYPAVEWFNVFAVDNVLQRIADPVFVGATVLSGAACGAKVVSKAAPEEKVGVLCLADGVPDIVEYYELPPEMAQMRDEKGALSYRYGVTLNYLFRADKLREIASKRIPVHTAEKKIPHIGADGETVLPERANGYKLETLILDMIRLMGSCLPFEVVREREFAPIKNRTGTDSVESARELLQKNGVKL